MAYGGDTPVQSLMNWEAALRLAARLGSAWLGRACLVGLLLDVLDGSASQPSCRERAPQQSGFEQAQAGGVVQECAGR